MCIRDRASGNEAHDTFNHDVIVHGYPRGSERAARASDMHAATRLAHRVEATGLALIIVAAIGFIYVG